MSDGVTPSLAEIFREALRGNRLSLHTAMPGQVETVHPAAADGGQFVDVRLGLKRALRDANGGLVEHEAPVLPYVPVGFPQGGGFFMSLPLKVGDPVTVVFAERSIDQWIELATKAAPQAISPGDEGMHTLDGAIAIPCGPAPRRELLKSVHDTNLVIGVDSANGEGQIHIRPDGTIHLGKDGAADFVALAALVLSELNDIRTKFDTHTHNYLPGPGSATPTLVPNAVMGAASSVASTKTKSE